jgi:hypothetical protein
MWFDTALRFACLLAGGISPFCGFRSSAARALTGSMAPSYQF